MPATCRRILVLFLLLQLLACGDDGRTETADAGGDTGEQTASWQKTWSAEANAVAASNHALAVRPSGEVLLLQRFNGGIDGDATKEYRILAISGGTSQAHDFELAGGEVLYFEAGTFGAVALVRTGEAIYSLHERDSQWVHEAVSLIGDADWVVGRGADRSPMVAIQKDSDPEEIQVFGDLASGLSPLSRKFFAVASGERISAVAVDRANTVHLITSATTGDIHYAENLDGGSEQIPAEAGEPYFLPYPDGSLQLFNGNEIFNSYEGKTTWLDGGDWEDYDTVFVGSADKHGVRDDAFEYAWRLSNDDALFVCRPELASGDWASVDLKQSPLRSVLPESAMAHSGTALYLVSRRNATLYRLELDICSP